MTEPDARQSSLIPDEDAGPTCIACGSEDTEPVLDLPDIPVLCNLLANTREEAIRAPRGDLCLSFCRSCGHLFNRRFDPARLVYSEGYETSLHFSDRFRTYVEELAERLVRDYALRGKTVVEIGCGEGEFLSLLCKKGAGRGIGFDTSYSGEHEEVHRRRNIAITRAYYTPERGNYDAALVCCRHVLEHVAEPGGLIETVRRGFAGRPDTVIYFEVPNARYTLDDLGIWDLIYEHCSYFTLESLTALFRSSGFELRGASDAYGGQFLGLDAMPSETGKAGREDFQHGLDELRSLVRSFSERYGEKFEEWQGRLSELEGRGDRAVIWGAGSKGITFLSALRSNQESVDLVDISPRKQGKFVPGSGHRILRPDELAGRAPGTVILMNPIYRDEVAAALATLGVDAEIVSA